jgi:hypothetical protein
VGDRSKWERLDHEKHSFDDLSTHQLGEKGRLLDGSLSGEGYEQSSELLDCSDAVDADFDVLFASLVDVGVRWAEAVLA